jgi:hypothetical protein
MSNAKRDGNYVPTLLAVSVSDGVTPVPLYADPTTHRLYVDLAAGAGTVTSVSVVSANGFAGTVASPTVTPAITLTTTVTGILKGNGTAISAATVNTDYLDATSIGVSVQGYSANNTTLGNTTTGSGSIVLASTPTLVTPVLGVATATSVNKVAITAPATSATLTIADGKTLTASNSLTFTGTDGSSLAIGTGGTLGTAAYTAATAYATAAQTFFIGTTQVSINRASAALTLAGITLTTPDIGTPSAGTLTNCTGLPVAGIVASTSTALGVGTLELGHASDTTLSRSSAGVLAVEGVVIPSISSTNTLTNKRITKREQTTASTTTLTITSDSVDITTVTAQAAGLTIAAPTGTPTQGQSLLIRIKDNGTARALTWNAIWKPIGVTLPTTTVISKLTYVGAVYNSTSSQWDVLAVGQEV